MRGVERRSRGFHHGGTELRSLTAAAQNPHHPLNACGAALRAARNEQDLEYEWRRSCRPLVFGVLSDSSGPQTAGGPQATGRRLLSTAVYLRASVIKPRALRNLPHLSSRKLLGSELPPSALLGRRVLILALFQHLHRFV